jgi:DNA-binding SARP family transcriptional activator/tetratricopeptide (TPR) repeat protein
MWFGVLGPLQVRDENSVIGEPAGLQRVLLASLLVRAGAVVPADALAEEVWDGSPPAGAEATLRSYVMRLRRMLGPAAGARVVTRYPGYLIEASEEEVDLLRFRRLCREGGDAVRAGEWGLAWEVLTEALVLWRGEPLADVRSGLLRRNELPGLEGLRLQAAEWRMDAGLQLGRHSELVAELHSLVEQYPLRERFHAQLMLALVRSARQAEALQAYTRARAVLVEELGTEPGSVLRELHQQILAADPLLAAPPSAAPARDRPAAAGPAGPTALVPRELPAPVAGFVGRSGELATLSALLDRSHQQARPAIVISAIGGTAGVGKTALAVQWAHQVVGLFPDGQLYVNLRGYDPDRPMTAAEALAGFLHALGVPGRDIPPREDERAARYRSLVAGKRVLIVLDNAGSVEQVRPLLPGSASCAVVVTSRDALAGLVARDGATRLELGLLPLPDAIGLLRVLIGRRIDEDTADAETLAGQCCRLPLALRVAAELSVARPDVPLAQLVGELTDQQRRLDLLDAGGDPRTAVRTVFSWSYRHLDPDAARAFRLAGLHPGPDFEAYAAAALTGDGLEQARTVLGALARAHLIQPAGPGRYGLHDLLRAYARELAEAHDGEDDQREALTRLLDHYLHTAAAAMDTLYPAERHRRPRIRRSAGPQPPVTKPAAALKWLDDQRAVLVALIDLAAAGGWSSYVDGLAVTLFRYLDQGGYCAEALTIHTRARQAAGQAGDRAAEGRALFALGATYVRQRRVEEAIAFLGQALEVFRDTADQAGQARTLHSLGLTAYDQGRYRQAAGYHAQALSMFRAAGDRKGEASVLVALGTSGERRGQYNEAADSYRQALALYREIADRSGEANAIGNLGILEEHTGRYAQAADYHRQALTTFREIGNRIGEVQAFNNLGRLNLRQGRLAQATDDYREALALARQTGDRLNEAEALCGLGEVMLASGRPDEARTQYLSAVTLARQVGAKHEQADAHNGLGHAARALGDPRLAGRHWQQALALFTELGAPEADRVRAQLAAADDTRPERETTR